MSELAVFRQSSWNFAPSNLVEAVHIPLFHHKDVDGEEIDLESKDGEAVGIGCAQQSLMLG